MISSLYKNLAEWFWWNWHDEKTAFSIWLFGPFVAGVSLWVLVSNGLERFIFGSVLFWLLGMGFYIRLSIWHERNNQIQ